MSDTVTTTTEQALQFAKNLPPGTNTSQIAQALGSVAAGAGLGSAVPGIGTAVGAAVGLLMAVAGVPIKGKTEVFDWPTSHDFSEPLSHQIASELQLKLTPDNFRRLASDLPPLLANYIESSGAWNLTTARTIAKDIRTETPFDGTSYAIVQACMFRLLMWIVNQSDNAHSDLLQGYIVFYFYHTAGALLRSYGVTDFEPTVSSTIENKPTTTATSKPVVKTAGLSFTGDKVVLAIVVLVVVGLLVAGARA